MKKPNKQGGRLYDIEDEAEPCLKGYHSILVDIEQRSIGLLRESLSKKRREKESMVVKGLIYLANWKYLNVGRISLYFSTKTNEYPAKN